MLNLVFPVFGYSLTNFPSGAPENYDIDLDAESLEAIGITLIDAESHNLTFPSAWIDYTDLNKTYRARFRPAFGTGGAPLGDGVQVQTSPVDGWLTWLFGYFVNIVSLTSGTSLEYVSNATIIADYDTRYNWSRFDLGTGEKLFITPNDPTHNITYAVNTVGHINVTIGKAFEETTDFNFMRFASWYVSIMVGGSSWGLPDIFAWITRILGALSILATVMLARELIGFT
ncbi:MAG: hypothetical protein ACYS76_04545 [Planctomycetota bacterium]